MNSAHYNYRKMTKLFEFASQIIGINECYEQVKFKYHKYLNQLIDGKSEDYKHDMVQAINKGYTMDETFSDMKLHARDELYDDAIFDYRLFGMFALKNYGKTFNYVIFNVMPVYKDFKNYPDTIIEYNGVMYLAKD